MRVRTLAVGLAATLVAAGLAAPAAAATRWLPAETLSAAGPGHDAFNPQVALDGRGNALAVWELWDGASSSPLGVQAARRPAGGSWGPSVTLSGPGTDHVRLAVNSRGAAVVVWRLDDGTEYRIQAVRRPAGGSWGSPVTLSDPGQDPWEPEVAVDARGNATAVWWGASGTQAARRPAGGSWGRPVTLSGLHTRSARVAVNGRGAVVVVWQRGGTTVVAARRPAGGRWGRPVTVSADGGAPEVALDGRGAAVVVWRHVGGGGSQVQAARQPAGGSWGRPVTLSDRGQHTAHAQVAVNWRGTAVVVWELSDAWGFPRGVQAARRPSGGAWGRPVTLSEPDSFAGGAQVAVDGQGIATAVWSSSAVGSPVQTARRPAGGAWGRPVTVSDPGQNAGRAQVAVDGQGTAVAVWEQSDGTSYRVQAARRPAGGS